MRTVIEIAPGAFFVRSYSEQTIAPFQYGLTTQGLLLVSDELPDLDTLEEQFQLIDLKRPTIAEEEVIEDWLRLAEDTFNFWDNDLDAAYDNL